VRRVETIIAEEHPAERVPWLLPFRERYDKFYEEGQTKGINFSLSVAIEFARRMLATAQDSDEHGIALILLGNALSTLGQREPGTARLEKAVSAYRNALLEWTRERVPLQWAGTQNNLGTALSTLGQREPGIARLEEAVSAYDAALVVFVEAGAERYIQVCQANKNRLELVLKGEKTLSDR
jgi:tetratricopeptide (TPR) repeat protein